ncbi:MAG: ABC transporter substrate-binding protein [Verminephrobacter sp.]|nr:ABC transporter substrate-binding protein [Verminephrobacter sp.]
MANPDLSFCARRRGGWLRPRSVAKWVAGVLIAGSLQAWAQPSTAVHQFRVVGGLAGISQYTRWEEPFWTRELPRISGGRFRADIVPFDRAGVPGEEMLRLVQLGVVPFGTALLSSLTATFPQYTAPDLAGLNPDIASLRASVAAFRPYLEQTLRKEQGVEVLALYVYPAQVLFCRKPLAGLSDLSGRRVRVSSAGQADFVGALGAVPVHTAFAQIVRSMEAGSMDCAITGTMSGNTLGLHAITTHLHAMPITWGLAIFGANRAAWEALPPDLRALLRQELPRLEASIWEESERDTAQGIACNSGAPSCTAGRKGQMLVVPLSEQDERRRQEIFRQTVLPRWLQRCGPRCTDIWNQTIGAARGLGTQKTP